LTPIKIHPKFQPLWNDKESRYFIITGGRGSGKSFGVGVRSAQLTFEKEQRILFTRYTMTSAHISVIPEFVEKVELIDAVKYMQVNKTEIRNNLTGAEVIFKGIKTSQGTQTANLKSLQGVSTWILDEAEELHDEAIFDDIDMSVRTNGVQNRVIIILNPSTKEHWIYKRFFQDAGVKEGFNGTKDGVCYIHSDYRDNIANLSKSFIDGIERMKIQNPAKYKHKILGGWLEKAEGVIFDNWSFGAFDDALPAIWGQDYGYSSDPTTLVKVAVDKKRGVIYLHEELYKAGMDTQAIYNANYRAASDTGLIVGDNAEPRLIQELRTRGLNIKACEKMGVAESVRMLLDFRLVVTPSSTNIAKELNNYQWSDRKSETPIDDFNHTIDAIRYAVIKLIGKPNNGKYFIY
jgi:phage terminase large subunit